MQTPTNGNPNTLSLHHMESWSNRLLLLSDLGGWPTLPLELLANHLSPRQGQHCPCLSHIPRARWVHTEFNYTPSPPSIWGSHISPMGSYPSPSACCGPWTSDSSFQSLLCTTEGTGTISSGRHEDWMKYGRKFMQKDPAHNGTPVCLLFSRIITKRRKRAVLWIVEGNLDYISENQVFISFFFLGGGSFC